MKNTCTYQNNGHRQNEQNLVAHVLLGAWGLGLQFSSLGECPWLTNGGKPIHKLKVDAMVLCIVTTRWSTTLQYFHVMLQLHLKSYDKFVLLSGMSLCSLKSAVTPMGPERCHGSA